MKKTIYIILGLTLMGACSVKKKNTTTTTPPATGITPPAFDKMQVDKTVTPCDNFYKYANGIWMQKNPVPSTESRWASFNILAKENDAKLQTILDEVVAGTHTKGTNKQLIADLYKSAMNAEAKNKAGLTALNSIIAATQAVSNKRELSELYPTYAKMAIGIPFAVYVSRDKKNSEKYIVTLTQSGLGLPNRDYYLKEDEKFKNIRTEYVKHINAMMKLAGWDNKVGQSILDYETKIAKAQWSITEQRDPVKTYNKMPCMIASDQNPELNLNYFLEKNGLNKEEEMIVAQLTYFAALNGIIHDADLTTLKNYQLWHILGSYANHINDDFEKEDFRFYSTILRGTKEMKPKAERVLNSVNGMLGEPLGQLFVEKYFPESAKKYIGDMIENLRSAYKESIMNLTWMGDTTKQKALKKLASFTYKVGYPDEWKDYSSLDINAENYLQNVINTRLFGYNLMVDKLGKPVDKKEWGMTPQTVNAYYSSSGNEIVFPAGILQPPFFHISYDDAINYGGIGGVIGHEFTHGFDDQGSKYDGEGNLNNWWTDADRAAFAKLTKQLADQYSSYEPLPGMNIKGDMTLGENIADLGGLTLGFAALKKKLDGTTPALIDGYTWQQRFYLGWANVWKQNINDDELKNRLITDVHSPGEYRVLGPLSNIAEFQEAFGCPDGCKMSKKKEEMIKIW
jgi:putative endopeptidase